MVEYLDTNSIKFTRSSDLIIGFLWFSNGTFETIPFKTEGYSTKSNLPAGTYKIKEYDAEGNVFDVDDGVIVIEA